MLANRVVKDVELFSEVWVGMNLVPSTIYATGMRRSKNCWFTKRRI